MGMEVDVDITRDVLTDSLPIPDLCLQMKQMLWILLRWKEVVVHVYVWKIHAANHWGASPFLSLLNDSKDWHISQSALVSLLNFAI